MSEKTTLRRRDYYETIVRGQFDPVSVTAALAGSGRLSGYVAYEREGRIHLGANPIGSVTVDRNHVRSTLGEGSTQAWSGTPWPQVGAALEHTPVPGWRAYGWACFELAHPAAAPHDVLAHMMIPAIEFDIGEDAVLIRTCESADDLPQLVADLKHLAADLPGTRPRPVHIAETDPQFLRAVGTAVDRIRTHALQKVILSRVVDIPFPVDMPATYVTGRRANTPARSFLVDLGGWQVAGFSPETVLEVDTDGIAATQPLAGTRARTGDAEVDRTLRAKLLTDPKEVFEHAISVRLAVEELTTIGRAGATRVSEFLEVKARHSVQHLGSRVETRLAPPHSRWDALGAVFPAITASGLPKAAACQVIGELESRPRGLYGGAVLIADHDGELDAALVLRAVYQRAGRAWLRAGAGVVSASTPAREHEETCEKFGSVAPYLVPAAHPFSTETIERQRI
ncbi:salicylate synthase [Nocardia amamiensis]|uniref:Salicylate synthase n=1 Tax=Nocardia amamiensis TaxID=404578 RepID=A0ABS0CXI8_9NOCA|nr:salicylate synthase [Nocardia amamiensis]MBF6301317.1 salicylate synthase [Nocardia amamiensis]